MASFFGKPENDITTLAARAEMWKLTGSSSKDDLMSYFWSAIRQQSEPYHAYIMGRAGEEAIAERWCSNDFAASIWN